MGVFLNQLPPTEVARLKAELAETLIANFCYPRFYDYRVNALRMRPVDRAKRQEVWQYLNAVDFNVWGRVDVDSPDFQRQLERLFIHFVQRNRNFFGPQGRRRMNDVRTLITSTSNTLAEGLRLHLRGKPENPPFGSPRPVSSWSTTNITGRAEPAWEQILVGTMLLQQQLQEVRNEVRASSSPAPALPPQVVPASARPSSVPSRRSRSIRSVSNDVAGNGNGGAEDEAVVWPAQSNRGEGQVSAGFPTPSREAAPAISASTVSTDAAPTMPLPLGRPESPFSPFSQPEATPIPLGRSRRGTGKPPDLTPATSLVPAPASGPARKPLSQHLPAAQTLQEVASSAQVPEAGIRQVENAGALLSDEDVVIFEQLRHQLVVWLRVETICSGVELNGQGAFQLVELLRHQDGIDLARLQIVSTLLNMCDQIITTGRATLFDYKQAMMFYLMHTRRTP